MELTPKLLAAADMCSAGEEVNLDELSFLLRYAAEELSRRPHSGDEQEALMATFRKRLLARCELLDRPESLRAEIRGASIERLIAIEEELDADLQRRFPSDPFATQTRSEQQVQPETVNKFQSGAA